METLIRALGITVFGLAVFQLVRSFYYPNLFSRWEVPESKANWIIWLARIGGVFGILVGIWMMFFVKL